MKSTRNASIFSILSLLNLFVLTLSLLSLAGCTEDGSGVDGDNVGDYSPDQGEMIDGGTQTKADDIPIDNTVSEQTDNGPPVTEDDQAEEPVPEDQNDESEENEVEVVPIEVERELLTQLEPVDNCDQVLEELKEKTIADVKAITAANLERALWMLEEEVSCYYPFAVDSGVGFSAAAAGASSTAPPSSNNASDDTSASSQSTAGEYSTTNTQEVGVDEADFVKNDGGYIYLLADGKFQIIASWPAAQTTRIASVDIEGSPKKLFVHNDRAVIYSSLNPLQQDEIEDYDQFFRGMPSVGATYDKECTYGYDCEFVGDGRELKITTFDISNKTEPVLLRETRFSGSYLNSRRIDDVVHTVVVFPEIAIAGVSYWPESLRYYLDTCYRETADFPFSEQELRFMFEELEKENQQVIQAMSVTDYLPSITDTVYVDGQPQQDAGLMQQCHNFFISGAGEGKSLLSLVSFKMDQLDEIGATTVVGKPGAVYASKDALYVAVRQYTSGMDTWFFDDPVKDPEATTIHKFYLEPGSIFTEYAGSGVAKGRILNQFSMDEHLDHLRIATTTGHLPSPDVHSTISVLAQKEGALEVVGMVDEIAPTEDIRSVRFNGETGFVVTFKKTDPLFVIDLSDAENPVVKGELKIPGYSTYMHLMDDNHLLTIGYDADDQGSFAWFQGIQLQIIDVSDTENPQLIHKEVTGMRGTTSEAATNHLAFNYFPDRDLLAIPMTVCEASSGGGSFGERMTFSGLLVFRVTLDDGFTYLGGVPHQEPETEYSSYGACSNWWTQSNSVVQRSIFMSDTESVPNQDYVYSIAMDLLNVSNLTDLENPVAFVELIGATNN